MNIDKYCKKCTVYCQVMKCNMLTVYTYQLKKTNFDFIIKYLLKYNNESFNYNNELVNVEMSRSSDPHSFSYFYLMFLPQS